MAIKANEPVDDNIKNVQQPELLDGLQQKSSTSLLTVKIDNDQLAASHRKSSTSSSSKSMFIFF